MVNETIKKLLKTIFIIAVLLILIIPKQELATSKIKLGDINGDSKIDQTDIVLLLRHISATTNKNHEEWILTGDKLKAADITENNTIDTSDVLALLRYIAANNSTELAKKHPEWLELKEIETIENLEEKAEEKNRKKNEEEKIEQQEKQEEKEQKTVENKKQNTIENKNTKVKETVKTYPTKISINTTSVELYPNANIKETTLKATLEPKTATEKNITFSSSNTKIATVNKNGKITGKSNGTATITAKTANGIKATCKVKVKAGVYGYAGKKAEKYYYRQTDKKWHSYFFGTWNGNSYQLDQACTLFAITHCIGVMTEKYDKVTPDKLAVQVRKLAGTNEIAGSTTKIKNVVKLYGLKWEPLKKEYRSVNEVKKLFKNGGTIWGSLRDGDYYYKPKGRRAHNNGHSVMWYKYENGYFYAKDSARDGGGVCKYPEKEFNNYIKRGYFSLIKKK